MTTTKDGKWKPATKVVSFNQTAPHSYNIVTTQGQQYCRNRKHLRKVAGGKSIGTNVDDFLDDDPHVANSTETTTSNSDDSEPVPPIISAPAMRHSQQMSDLITLTHLHYTHTARLHINLIRAA